MKKDSETKQRLYEGYLEHFGTLKEEEAIAELKEVVKAKRNKLSKEQMVAFINTYRKDDAELKKKFKKAAYKTSKPVKKNGLAAEGSKTKYNWEPTGEADYEAYSHGQAKSWFITEFKLAPEKVKEWDAFSTL